MMRRSQVPLFPSNRMAPLQTEATGAEQAPVEAVPTPSPLALPAPRKALPWALLVTAALSVLGGTAGGYVAGRWAAPVHRTP